MLLLGQLGWLLFLPLLSLLSAGLIVWLASLLKPARRREAPDFISDNTMSENTISETTEPAQR